MQCNQTSDIYISLATDVGYLKQTFIVIESAMYHANIEDSYHFVLLINGQAQTLCQEYSLDMQNKYHNCKIECIVMDDIFLQIPNCHIAHITLPTYYRLLLPQLLECDKCIYLDSDVIITGDLRELFDIDIMGYDIAGVIAPSFRNITESQIEEHCRITNLPCIDSYINAGVLLMNLVQLRQNHFTEKALPLTENFYPVQDQDIINQLCYGRIKLIDFKYNFQAAYFYKSVELLYRLFSKSSIQNAIQNPLVVHYNRPKKPWTFFDLPFADLWWSMCKRTKFFEVFIQQHLNRFYYYGIISRQRLWLLDCFSDAWYEELNQRYPYIYIYGAGKIAYQVISELQRKKVNIQGVLVTKLADNPQTEILGLPIIQFSEKLDKNVLILVATHEIYQRQINATLLDHEHYYFLNVKDVL